MKVFVTVVFMAASQLATAQFNPKQKSVSQETRIAGKKPNAFFNAIKIPSVMIGMGVYACVNDDVINRYEIREERNEHLPNFHTSVDNYLMHAPIVAVYGLNLVGVKGKNDFKNRTILLIKSEVIMYALTYSFKSLTKVRRPDGTDEESFVSGHTAQAFATATFMAKEYWERSKWYAVGAYGMATAVGAMRILNNRHWVSDVLAGAGIGILSTNLAYLTHRYKWKNKNSQLSVIPTYTNGPAIYAAYKFN